LSRLSLIGKEHLLYVDDSRDTEKQAFMEFAEGAVG
jgi:hypothetical protein